MKLILLMLAVLLTVACGVDPIRHVESGNAKLDVAQIGEVDGCKIYRFNDVEVIYFVRCGRETQTSWERPEGKVMVHDGVQTTEGQ